jgi:hypothetical protein
MDAALAIAPFVGTSAPRRPSQSTVVPTRSERAAPWRASALKGMYRCGMAFSSARDPQ